jgi:hypothetical protein
MSKFEDLGTLEQFLGDFEIREISWNEENLINYNIPIHVSTIDEVQFSIICSSELSNEIREYKGDFIRQEGSYIIVTKETLSLNKRIVKRVNTGGRLFIRLSYITLIRTV